MKKTKLKAEVNHTKNETKEALQTIYDALNQGQQKKLVKDEKVKALLERYEII